MNLYCKREWNFLLSEKLQVTIPRLMMFFLELKQLVMTRDET